MLFCLVVSLTVVLQADALQTDKSKPGASLSSSSSVSSCDMKTTINATLEAPGLKSFYLYYLLPADNFYVDVSCPGCTRVTDKKLETCSNGVELPKDQSIVFDFRTPVEGFSLETEDCRTLSVRINSGSWVPFSDIGVPCNNRCSDYSWLTVTGCSISKVEIGGDTGEAYMQMVRILPPPTPSPTPVPTTPTPPTPTPPTPVPPTPVPPTPAPTTPAPTCPDQVVVDGGDVMAIEAADHYYVSSSCSCPEGEEIVDPADCAAAACSLGQAWNVMKASNSWQFHAKGCAKRNGPTDFGIYFNKHSTGGCSDWAKAVCVRK